MRTRRAINNQINEKYFSRTHKARLGCLMCVGGFSIGVQVHELIV